MAEAIESHVSKISIDEKVNDQFRTKKEKNGEFKVGWPGFKLPGPKGLIGFIWEGTRATIPNEQELDEKLFVETPDFKLLEQEEYKKGLTVYWLGHACVLVQMDGVRFLTDPVFSSKCGPSFKVYQTGPTRYRKAPCTVEELPDNIDFVVISHNHYDHLDVQSVIDIKNRYPGVIWCVPMGVKSWMIKTKCKDENVFEFEWWEQIETKGVTLTFVPAQHWTRRGALDTNKTLWGGWCVKGPNQNFYYTGDTGYPKSRQEIEAIENRLKSDETVRYPDGPELFKVIGRILGPFDLAAIPIGAYEPRWFMHCQHCNPEEALKIHKDVRAEKSIGIHWGTFNLSSEKYLEPQEKIEKAMGEDGDFFTVNPGGHKVLNKKTQNTERETLGITTE